jgi:hypothetical protein
VSLSHRLLAQIICCTLLRPIQKGHLGRKFHVLELIKTGEGFLLLTVHLRVEPDYTAQGKWNASAVVWSSLLGLSSAGSLQVSLVSLRSDEYFRISSIPGCTKTSVLQAKICKLLFSMFNVKVFCFVRVDAFPVLLSRQ